MDFLCVQFHFTINQKLKIFKKVVDEYLKTMYYIQVAYDRRFLKAKEEYTG